VHNAQEVQHPDHGQREAWPERFCGLGLPFLGPRPFLERLPLFPKEEHKEVDEETVEEEVSCQLQGY
jgi:hypothetical protein